MISGCFEYVSHWSARTLRRSACKTRHIDWAVQLYPVPLPPKVIPSLRHSPAMLSSPRKPSPRCPVCACVLVSSWLPNRATMSQESSLTQSGHSVRQALTAYNMISDGAPQAKNSNRI